MLASLVDEKGERPVLVHRLDRDTAGVLLVAKSRRVAAKLGEIFRSRKAQKIYWALVEGVPKPAQGRISLFLAKGEGMGDLRAEKAPAARKNLEKMQIVKHGDAEAQHSVTYYAVVDKAAPRLAWLSMKPITGRTHQLRAHAEAIGHPIIGDPKYSGDAREARRPGSDAADSRRRRAQAASSGAPPRPAASARRTLDVTAPLPPHMQKSFDLFGFDVKGTDPIENAPE